MRYSHLAVHLICSFLFTAHAQNCSSVSDSCVNACNLGILPAPPSTCQLNVMGNYLGQPITFSLTSIGAFADFPYILAACNQDYPASDVWYKMTVTGNQLFFTFTSTQILTPNIAIYKGNSCYNFQSIYFGKGTGGQLLDTVNYLTPNQTYYIQISGSVPLEKGTFDLTLQNNNKCDECLQEADFTTIPPQSSANIGDTIAFSFTLKQFSHAISNNWLHGIELFVGTGWDTLSIVPTQIPTSCTPDPGANWNYYLSETGGIFGQNRKRGFYYDTYFGGPLDGNPGNNFGDFMAGQGMPACSLIYQWKMVVKDCSNLGVKVNTLSDSESGSWGSLGCQYDRKPSLTFGCGNTCLPLPLMSGTAETCVGNNGTTTAIMPSGTAPFQYTWYDESLAIQSTTSGGNASTLSGLNSVHQYFVKIQDATGCETWGSMIVYEDFLPINAQITTQDVHCFGYSDGIANVTATGGSGNYTYNWTSSCGNSATCNNISAGQYQVIITGGISSICSDTLGFTINEPPLISANMNILQPIYCNGMTGIVEITNVVGGIAPYNYAWGTNPPQFSPQPTNLSAGTYVVFITDSNNCLFQDSITLSQPNLLSLNLTAQNVTCFGGSDGGINANVVGGISPYTYSWLGFSTNGNNLTNLLAGNYDCIVTDSNGCSDTTNTTVIDGNNLLLATNVGNVSCFGGNDGFISVQVSGGINPYIYSWIGTNQNTANATGLIAGSYDIWLSDANNCSATQTGITVSQPFSPLIAQIVSTDETCNNAQNGSINLSVSGGTSPYTTVWTPAISNLSQVAADKYSVLITDINGCNIYQTTIISEPLPLGLNLIQNQNAYCNLSNGIIEVEASGGTIPYSYVWNTMPPQNSSLASNLNTGTYTLTVTDANNCTSNLTSTIINIPPAIANFNATPNNDSVILLLNATIIFDNLSIGASNYFWDFGDGNTSTSINPQHTYLNDSLYIVTLIADNGYNTCPSIDTMSFDIIPNGSIRLASAFTPNNDGYNDYFSAIGSGIISFEMIIFDRWGKKVFVGNNLGNGWNGKSVSGEDAPEGVYTYYAKVRLNSGKYQELVGTITLIR